MSVFLLLSPRSLSLILFFKKKKEIDTWSSGHFYLSFPVPFLFRFFLASFLNNFYFSLSLFFFFLLLLGNPLLRVCVHLRVSLFLALCWCVCRRKSEKLKTFGRTDRHGAHCVFLSCTFLFFDFFFFFYLFVSSS